MPDDPDLAGLEAERARLYASLGQVGDFRRGALNAVRRKCGKPNCACVRGRITLGTGCGTGGPGRFPAAAAGHEQSATRHQGRSPGQSVGRGRYS